MNYSSVRIYSSYFLISSADIDDKVEAEIGSLGLKTDCVGGGRIEHNRDDKTILVYGYSVVSLSSWGVGVGGTQVF